MQSEADKEREEIVAWLREGGTTAGYRFATLGTRLRAAWVAFRAPWALAQGGCTFAANAIEALAHKGKDHEG